MPRLSKADAIGKEIKDMKKIKIAQQVLDPSGAGGVSSEFRALKNSNLKEKYDFVPVVLVHFSSGINIHDILFYYRKIKYIKPDIVHIRGAAVDGLNAVLGAKLAGKGKILVTVHGMYSDLVYIHPVKKWISKNIIERLIYRLADGISCVCKNAMEREYFNPYRSKMLPFVYNRIPRYDSSIKLVYRSEIRRRYNIPNNWIVALYIGRMTREKGLDVLIESFEKVQNMCPQNLIMLFVGDGDYIEQTKAFLKNKTVPSIFVGNQVDVEKFYDAGDFFIQPSLHENHSVSLLEACAAGLPSIASDCGGNTEIIDEEIGIIVRTGNSDDLGEAILKMCNEDIRNNYINKLKNRKFEKFSDECVDASLDLVYQNLVGG